MIGVFDSGFGGLSVLKEIVRVLPQYAYVYLGDSARAPYGSRPSAEVHQFTLEAIEFLCNKNCELIVLACNTTSAEALRKIQQEYLPANHPDRRVLGVIIPAAEEAVSKTKNARVGVLATEGTVRSGTFVRELQKLAPQIEVFQQACPLLVSVVEEGRHTSPEVVSLVAEYLAPLLEKQVDTIILGCTHYEHVLPQIRSLLGPDMTIISEAEVVARKLKEYLARHPEIEKRLPRDPVTLFYSTDASPRFNTLGSEFFGQPIMAKSAVL